MDRGVGTEGAGPCDGASLRSALGCVLRSLREEPTRWIRVNGVRDDAIARSNARDSPGFTEFHRASTETPRLSPSRTDIHHPRANERERLVNLRENRGQLPSLG